jgi:hypothetical protein
VRSFINFVCLVFEIFAPKVEILRFFSARPEVDIHFRFRLLVATGPPLCPEKSGRRWLQKWIFDRIYQKSGYSRVAWLGALCLAHRKFNRSGSCFDRRRLNPDVLKKGRERDRLVNFPPMAPQSDPMKKAECSDFAIFCSSTGSRYRHSVSMVSNYWSPSIVGKIGMSLAGKMNF